MGNDLCVRVPYRAAKRLASRRRGTAVLVAGAVVLAATVADRGGVMQVAAAGALVVVPVALDRIDRTRLPRIMPGWAARDNGADLQGRLAGIEPATNCLEGDLTARLRVA